METARKITLQALHKVEKDKSYSNLTIEPALKKSNLEDRDKSFAINLFYGVLENKILLDHIIKQYSNRPPAKISVDVLNILRMGIYQLTYLDLKDFAAVNESVLLCKAVKQKSASGFINAVLRQFIRDGKKINYPDKQRDFNNYLSVRYSCPIWLVNKLINSYGERSTEDFLSAQLGKPPLNIRVNTNLISSNSLLEKFNQIGINAEPHSFVKDCITITNGTDIINTEIFNQGLFHVQDVSSLLCSACVAEYKPKAVLDTCAAPGGKTFTIAQLLKDSPITACDLHSHRSKLIASGAARLKLNNVRTMVQDASEYNPKLGTYDLVLCDVPCSGFGVIRRKPEIKYKTEKEITRLPEIQNRIINCAARYVHQNGILIYSTCTVLPEENQMVVEKFLSENKDFEPCRLPDFVRDYYPQTEYQVTMLPSRLDNDGFFICAMKRKGESV